MAHRWQGEIKKGMRKVWGVMEMFIICIFNIIYFQREGKGGRQRGRETSMWERNIDQLPLARPQLGTWPATQACDLPGNRTSEL